MLFLHQGGRESATCGHIRSAKSHQQRRGAGTRLLNAAAAQGDSIPNDVDF